MFCYIPYGRNLVHFFSGSVTRSLLAFLRLQKGAKRGGGCARKGGRDEGAREGGKMREEGAREQIRKGAPAKGAPPHIVLCASLGSTGGSWNTTIGASSR